MSFLFYMALPLMAIVGALSVIFLGGHSPWFLVSVYLMIAIFTSGLVLWLARRRKQKDEPPIHYPHHIP
jgi:hypothetical protein